MDFNAPFFLLPTCNDLITSEHLLDYITGFSLN